MWSMDQHGQGILGFALVAIPGVLWAIIPHSILTQTLLLPFAIAGIYFFVRYLLWLRDDGFFEAPKHNPYPVDDDD